jgi:WD40 repeat protein
VASGDLTVASAGEPERIFLSVAGPDAAWGDWIYRQLRQAGNEVDFYRRSFPVGGNFVASIDAALATADRMVAVFSPAYCDPSSWVTEEWRAALQITRRRPGFFVPLLVEPCTLPPLLDGLNHIDVVGMDEDGARSRLLAALRGSLGDDTDAPFPGRLTTGQVGAGRPRVPGRGGYRATPGRAVTILQLPGIALHQPAGGSSPYGPPLWEDLDRLAAGGGPRPDIVAVTGVAATGRKAEYADAEALLDGLLAHLELGRDRVAIVPGRGDVNAAACRTYFAACEEDEVAPVRPYWRKWRHYAGFFADFYRHTGTDRDAAGPTFAVGQEWSLFALPDLRVAIAGLNSTMAMSHRAEDDDVGEIGDAQARWFAERLERFERDRWLRIAIGHHPPLAERAPDSRAMRDATAADLILGRHLNLVLTAHGGTPERAAGRGGAGEDGAAERPGRSGAQTVSCHPVMAGSRGAGGAAAPGYQLVRLDPAGLTRFDRQLPRDSGGWRPDTRAGPAGTASSPARWRQAGGTFPKPTATPQLTADWDAAGPPGHAGTGRGVPGHPGGDSFAERVAEVARLRHRGAHISTVEPAAAGPTDDADRRTEDPAAGDRTRPGTVPAYLRVTVADGPVFEQRPVGVHPGDLDGPLVEAFTRYVHRPYAATDPHLTSDLVYGGAPADPALVRRGARLGVRVVSFVEYQGLLDLRGYVRRQSARLAADPLYPPELYLPQRFSLPGDRDGPEVVRDDLLGHVVEWLTADQARFILLLGDFGRGKTFLLHELARCLPDTRAHLVPVLVDLRSMEKAHTVDELIASHLVAAGEERVDIRAFRYMLRSGRIVLMFDGFDELALRVTYDTAAGHLGRLLDAVEGQAKIVVTSRTQHFLSHGQVRSALGARVELLPASRVAEVEDFTEAQILGFLTRLYGGDAARAADRLDLIRDVRDLLGLSANPRMLGFIAALDADRLLAVRDRSGIISSADLYGELLDTWLLHEEERSAPRGAGPTLTAGERRAAVTALARVLWRTTDRLAGVAELTTTTAAALTSMARRGLNEGQVAHLIGSGSLLIRTPEGGFTFIHQSVLEYLVAADAARPAGDGGGGSDQLRDRVMSPLMVDFYCGAAGTARAAAWARATVADPGAAAAARVNALAVAHRTDRSAGRGGRLAGADLKGADLGDLDLTGADLTGADLTGARFTRTVFAGATLRGARLTGARFERADLTGADLTDADLTDARLVGCDLTGATLDGGTWSTAAVVGTTVDPATARRPELAAAAVTGRDAASVVLDAAGAAYDVAFAAARDLLAYAVGARIILADPRSGRVRQVLGEDRGYVRAWTFSDDGDRLIFATDHGTVTTHHLDTSSATSRRHRVRGAWTMALSPAGTILARTDSDGALRLWDLAADTPLRVLPGWRGRVDTLRFSPDGRLLASGGADGVTRIWDVATATELVSFTGHAGSVRRVLFSPDGTCLASAGDDGAVWCWDVPTAAGRAGAPRWGRPAGEETGVRHSGGAFSLAFSPSGELLASGGEDGAIRVFHRRKRAVVATLAGHGSRVLSLAFSADATVLASTGEDRTIRLWDVATARPTVTVSRRLDRVRPVVFTPDGQRLASAGDDGTVRLWNPRTGALTARLAGHTSWARSLAFTPDGTHLATAANDRTVGMWDLATGVRTTFARDVWIRRICFSPDGTRLAGAGDDGDLRLWSPANPGPATVLAGHTDTVWAVAFAPDGRRLASGSSDGTVRLWDLAGADGEAGTEGTEGGTGSEVLRGHDDIIHCVAFSPDGSLLASSGSDGGVRLWALGGGGAPAIAGHALCVETVTFSPDGTLLASASADRTIGLWSAATGALVTSLTGHTGWVRSVTFSPDARLLASGADDGTVRLWDTATWAPVATLVGLPDGAWATLMPDGSYKLDGAAAGALWWAIKGCRFEPGELDPYVPAIRRLPPDAPLPGLA